jgi:Domain of unknown function (DUF4440)
VQDDRKTLEELNIRISIEESKGDGASQSWLDSILAPQLAFRRADGITFDNRDEFLKKVKHGDPRETELLSVDLYGDRAIVTCVVTTKPPTGDKKYHNLRLFVRSQGQGEWKLLGWANEPL